MAGIIIEPGFFSILSLKQGRHSRQNVHSDDSFLGRFRPSHAGSQHMRWVGKAPTCASSLASSRQILFYLFNYLLLYFMAGIIIEPGFFSILSLKQGRHSRQNVHSDDSFLGRFRPSHAGSQHMRWVGKAPTCASSLASTATLNATQGLPRR